MEKRSDVLLTINIPGEMEITCGTAPVKQSFSDLLPDPGSHRSETGASQTGHQSIPGHTHTHIIYTMHMPI